MVGYLILAHTVIPSHAYPFKKFHNRSFPESFMILQRFHAPRYSLLFVIPGRVRQQRLWVTIRHFDTSFCRNFSPVSTNRSGYGYFSPPVSNLHWKSWSLSLSPILSNVRPTGVIYPPNRRQIHEYPWTRSPWETYRICSSGVKLEIDLYVKLYFFWTYIWFLTYTYITYSKGRFEISHTFPSSITPGWWYWIFQ